MKITKRKMRKWEFDDDSIKYVEAFGTKDAETIMEKLVEFNPCLANLLIVRLMSRKQRISYAVFAAVKALPIFEGQFPENKRPRESIDAARKVIEHNTKRNRLDALASAHAGFSVIFGSDYNLSARAASSAFFAARTAADVSARSVSAAYAAANTSSRSIDNISWGAPAGVSLQYIVRHGMKMVFGKEKI